MKDKDLIGKRFGRLTILDTTRKSAHNRRWIMLVCRCSCGAKTIKYKTSVISGVTKSCGCLRADTMRVIKRKHGLHGTPTYRTWSGMVDRCTNKNTPAYKSYGKRGIRVCKKWLTFEGFHNDMGTAPNGFSIERINNNSGYYKSNCLWASRKQQANNRRSSRVIQFNGESKTLAQWAAHTGIGSATIAYRIKAGWKIEKVMSENPDSYKNRANCKSY